MIKSVWGPQEETQRRLYPEWIKHWIPLKVIPHSGNIDLMTHPPPGNTRIQRYLPSSSSLAFTLVFNYWPPFTFVHEWSCDLGSNLCGGCGISSVFLCTFLNNTGQQPLRSAEDDLISHSTELGPPCPYPWMAFLVSYQYVFQSTASTRRSIGREFRWHAIVCLVPGLCWVHYCASMHQVTTGGQVKRIRVRAFFRFWPSDMSR